MTPAVSGPAAVMPIPTRLAATGKQLQVDTDKANELYGINRTTSSTSEGFSLASTDSLSSPHANSSSDDLALENVSIPMSAAHISGISKSFSQDRFQSFYDDRSPHSLRPQSASPTLFGDAHSPSSYDGGSPEEFGRGRPHGRSATEPTAVPRSQTGSPVPGRRASQPEHLGVLARLRRAVTPSSTSGDFLSDSSSESGASSPVGSSRRRKTSKTALTADPPGGVRETSVIDKVVDEQGNKLINRYILYETLGQGRHGKVKRCADAISGTVYAMKIVKKNTKKRFGVKESSPLEKIQTEIAILKKCDHPNVVKLIEVLDNAEHQKVYLVLEYLELGAVQWRTETDERLLDEDTSRQYFRDVLLGLEYLQYQGVVHRDIKPANLLLTADNRVKISDFGISYITMGDAQDDIALSKTEGTPYFLAPELCPAEDGAAPMPVGKAMDVWALGVTLYCFLVGSLPFLGQQEFELYGIIRTQEPFYPPSLSDDARDLLQQLLRKDPLRRPSFEAIKRHAWVTHGLDDVEAWIKETDPARKAAIKVTQEEVRNAFTFFERMRGQMRRLSSSVSNLMLRRSRSSSMESGMLPESPRSFTSGSLTSLSPLSAQYSAECVGGKASSP